MVAAERLAVQLPRARRRNLSKPNDLAREAVGCNGGLGRASWCASCLWHGITHNQLCFRGPTNFDKTNIVVCRRYPHVPSIASKFLS
jgi:hypothetical protein